MSCDLYVDVNVHVMTADALKEKLSRFSTRHLRLFIICFINGSLIKCENVHAFRMYTYTGEGWLLSYTFNDQAHLRPN